MKTGSDHQLDKFSKRIFKESGLESPESDFTQRLMSQIESSANRSLFIYKPLISLKAWVFIVIAALSALSIALMVSWEPVAWLSALNKPYEFAWSLSDLLPEVELSKPMLYAAVLFGLLLFVQIGYLNSYFKSRIRV
ncbi:MAG: hypothetical protein HKO90_01335 [Flavobacteriaceae bacterium]|nr:hypothetical protein [Flavobacteriaceae bacterium]